jgi:hypothetical protein
MSPRSAGRLTRAAITVAVGVAVVAASALVPLTAASAQVRPVTSSVSPAPPKSRPHQWSAAQALKSLRRPAKVNPAATRAAAIAHAASTEKTASYRISRAMLAYLDNGLGMRLGSSTLLTGVRSGATVRVSLPAPSGLRLDLPAGIRQPRFDRSVLVIDPATGTATLSANSTDGALRIGIPDAAAAVNPSGQLSLRLPVLGQTASLSGQVGYRGDKVTVSLSGQLPGSVALQRGVAGLAAGAEVTLTSAGGLRVSGSAVLGHSGRQLDVPVSGVPVGGVGDWTFTVLPGQVSSAPLPGLTLSPKASGTIISTHGAVTFDVSVPTARPWTPVHGVSVSGTAVFSNDIPNGREIPAPGIAARTLEADVSGTVSVTSAQAGTVTTHGAVAFNLASGKGILTSSGATPVVLTTAPSRQVLDQAGFRGQLALGNNDVTGSVRGTGRVSVTGKGRSVTTDTALSVSPSGTLAARIPSAAAALSAAAPPGRAAASATAANATYTLSGPVYDFITGTLNVPLGSATLSGTLSGQTLTLSASAPTALPSSLPSWIPNPSYVSTQISVDESTGTLTLTAATGTSGGQTATLTVTIANASTSDLSSGTDVTGGLVLGGVPFVGGSAASLDFALGYTGGALSASLSGTTTSDASFSNGLVTIPAGASLTLATGSGVALNGTADINSGSSSTQITVDGTLTDLTDWSLQVSDADAPMWEPTAGLSVTPDFSGSITDKAGAIGFDLASAGSGPAATWTSPDGNAVVSVTGIEVSNQAPSATCSTAQEIKDGDLWIGLSGDFSYAPAGLADLSATGCFDLTAGTAAITTEATGDLTSEFGSSLPFTVTAAGLTAKVSSAGTYSLTGTATVQITAGVSGDPVFTDVGLSFSNTGVVAGVQIKDLSDLGFSGSGALYLSSAAISGFDPGTTFGFTDQTSPVDLKAGLDVSLSYTLPTSVTSAFQRIVPGFPGGASGQAMATLSTSGFSLDVGLTLPTPLLVASNSGSGVSFYLDQLDVGIDLGSENQVTLSGTGDLELPAMAPGGQASSVSVKVGGYFNITTVTLGVTLDVGAWDDAFGVTGLDVQDFGGSFGLALDTGVPTPSLSIYADNLVLPASWANAIGVVPGTEISFNGNFSLSQPVLSIELDGVDGQPALTPLAIDPDASSTVVNSFIVSTAEFDLAPFGGTNGAGQSVDQGASVIFDASIVGVQVQVNAAVDLTTPSVSAYVSVGSFSTGQVQVSNTVLDLDLSPSNLGLYLSGGISSGNYSFSATFNLQLGSSAAGAGVSLQVIAGLPGYLQGYYAGGYLYLNGSVNSDGTISAYGAGWLTAGGQTLGPVSFSLSLPGGLSWSDYYNSIDTIVQFFQNAGTSASEIVDILESLGYDTYDIVNALGSLGDYSSGWLSDLASLFGFSSTYYDIVAQNGLVLDVSGASQSPSTQVITYTVNGGDNQSWAFVPSPYSGWYDVVNRNSGQCLTVQYNTATPGNSLIQYPCNDGINQLWYMGSISSFSTYVMWDPFYSNSTEEVADIQSAYIWPGGTMDQWTYNGGWNQEFTLINSLNY